MRKFLLILLVMLVPLQSPFAAAASICYVQEANASASVGLMPPPPSPGDAHAVHGGGSNEPSVVRVGHHDPSASAEHVGHDAQAHQARGQSTADPCDDDCASVAHHACCHAPAIAVPVAVSDLQPPSGSADLAASPARPPRPRFSDGLFRPPRAVTA